MSGILEHSIEFQRTNPTKETTTERLVRDLEKETSGIFFQVLYESHRVIMNHKESL